MFFSDITSSDNGIYVLFHIFAAKTIEESILEEICLSFINNGKFSADEIVEHFVDILALRHINLSRAGNLQEKGIT